MFEVEQGLSRLASMATMCAIGYERVFVYTSAIVFLLSEKRFDLLGRV